MAVIAIEDFELETVNELLDFMYTSVIKNASLQPFIAAVKYGVHDLKTLCEEELSKTTNIGNIFDMLYLVDRFDADELFNNVMLCIRENFEAFVDFEETKKIFMENPALGYKIFSKIL